ncbi:MAG: ABC transporter permease [Bacteroidota bacterium]
MFDLDKWQEIMHSLLRSPLRTFLTALGIFWGMFMLVVMMGAGNGLESGVRDDMGGKTTNSLFIWTRQTTKAYKGFQPGRRFSMTNEDYFALQELLPKAEYICPRNELGGFGGGNGVTRGNKSGSFEVTGDYPQIRFVETMDIASGRFINQIDMDENRKVCVIGQRVKELLFEADEEPVGDYIEINDTYFQVVGVFTTRATGGRAERETQKVFVPFTTFQKAFNYGNTISWFAITAKPGESGAALEEETIAILQKRHSVSPDDLRAFGHYNMEEEFEEIENVFFGIRGISWIVGFFTLLAGAIGISNIMLVTVKERTKEFGIRRALGAKPFSIISQVVAEAIILTVVSGYLGLLLGMGLLEGIAMAIEGQDTGMFGQPYVDLELAIRALIILMAAGLLAGLIPAQRAVRVKPVEALRAE